MLLASIHDVAPKHLAAVARLRDAMLGWGVQRATLLVVPNYHGQRLSSCPETLRWLRARVAAGDEVCLHGDEHRERGPVVGLAPQMRAALLSRGEAEYLSHPAVDIVQHLIVGKRSLEDAVGAAVAGFVAPSWLEPVGFGDHLRRAGFEWHESSLWIERLCPSPASDSRLHSPVLSFAGGSTFRRTASVAWVRTLRAPVSWWATRTGRVARVAIHPVDHDRPEVMQCAEDTLRLLARKLPNMGCSDALREVARRSTRR